MWDHYRRFNICVMGILEGEEREKEIREIVEIKAENFQKFMQTSNHGSRRPGEH